MQGTPHDIRLDSTPPVCFRQDRTYDPLAPMLHDFYVQVCQNPPSCLARCRQLCLTRACRWVCARADVVCACAGQPPVWAGLGCVAACLTCPRPPRAQGCAVDQLKITGNKFLYKANHVLLNSDIDAEGNWVDPVWGKVQHKFIGDKLPAPLACLGCLSRRLP